MIAAWRTPYLGNKHLQTIIPALWNTFPHVVFERERIITPDHDFLDLDWLKSGSDTLVLVLHGLEGSSDSQYMKRTAKFLQSMGYDCVCLNFRGCSGTPNKVLKSYHSGATDDIHFITQYLTQQHTQYTHFYGVGFSLGGNVLLKFLGEAGNTSPIQKAIAISVPCDLASGAEILSRGFNRIYLHRFLKRLKAKVKIKEPQFPDAIDYNRLYTSRNFPTFDDTFTAPINGYASAAEYYAKCSSKPFIPAIKTPFVLINALNDPFLSSSCYPTTACSMNPVGTLLTPLFGGHVGFPEKGNTPNYYERKMEEFFI